MCGLELARAPPAIALEGGYYCTQLVGYLAPQ